jgi:hypothetical protein
VPAELTRLAGFDRHQGRQPLPLGGQHRDQPTHAPPDHNRPGPAGGRDDLGGVVGQAGTCDRQPGPGLQIQHPHLEVREPPRPRLERHGPLVAPCTSTRRRAGRALTTTRTP